MKTKLNSLRRKVANALLVTLFMMLILAVSIAGYMSYVQQQNRLGTRAQCWNMAMAVSEAGVEEALEAINNGITNGPPASWVFLNNGWTQVGTSNYMVHRTLPGGEYYVTNDMSNWLKPKITARGFVNMAPMASASPGFFFAAANTATPMLTRGVAIAAIKGSIFLDALAARNTINMNGNNGLVNSFDDITSGGLYSWPYSSSNGNVASLDGLVNVGNYEIYGQVAVGPQGGTNVGPNGVITGGVTQDANFTFPDVGSPSTTGYCDASQAPASNLVTLVSSASSANYSSYSSIPQPLTANQTLYTNTFWFTNSAHPSSYVTITTNTVVTIASTNPSVTYTTNCGAQQKTKTQPAWGTYCPSGPLYQTGNGSSSQWIWDSIGSTTAHTNSTYTYSTNITYIYDQYTYTLVTGPTYQTNHYDHVLGCVCPGYYLNSPTGLSGSTLVNCANVNLVAPNGFSMSGQDQLIIAPADTSGNTPSLALYVTGGSLSLGGQGLVNYAGYAENFSAWCTTNVTSVSISGNGQFVGTVVAPDATITFNGGGNNITNVIGAVMGNYINVNGHMEFHFPLSLLHALGTGRYLVQTWKEIP